MQVTKQVTKQISNQEITSACIVLPTYNEAKNIKAHLDKIFECERNQPDKEHLVQLSVLVVDDSSPDGTADIVREYQKYNPKVHLLLRTVKEGLGKAYIAGMQHAIELLDPDVIFEMDSDGQHNPDDIYRMLAWNKQGFDFIIGSRFVEGGSVADSWSFGQRIKSICARKTTQILLGLHGVKDCSGGFRAIRANLLKQMDLDNLNVRGYAFQAVILEEASHLGAAIKEIPIHFGDREEGESKMGLNDMLEGFWLFTRIKAKRIFSPSSRRQKNLYRVPQ